MKRLSHRLCLAGLAAGALMSAPLPAAAVAIYGGGASLPFLPYRAAFDTKSGVPFTSCNPISATCAAYAPINSVAGINAFLAQQSPNATPIRIPYESASIVYSEGTTGYGAGPQFLHFAGSEKPLTAAQLSFYATNIQPARGAAIQVPALGTPIVIAFNATGLIINHPVPAGSKTTIGGSSGLWLSRRAYCGIFSGTITNWNDPVLTADNGGVALTANLPIKVYRHSNPTGMTFLLTRHLAAVCNGSADKTTSHSAGALATWTGSVDTSVAWPAGFLSAIGSEGVAAAVAATPGAITYAAPDYTQQATTPVISPAPVAANLQNQFDYNNGGPISGDVPRPPAPTYTTAALSTIVVPATNTAAAWGAAVDTPALRNPTVSTAYPIAGFSLLDFYGRYGTPAEVAALKNLMTGWTGGTYDTQKVTYGFVPLPVTVRTAVDNWILSALGL